MRRRRVSHGRFIVERDGYGDNWPEARRRELQEAGGRCRKCGSKIGVSVHHRRKIALFVTPDGVIDYESANSPENLIALCDACHRAADGHAPLKGFRLLR